MSFLNPWFAVAVAAVVVPALLILYFLKLRRREELVPSTLLWKRAVQDLQVNAPFQRLRRNLLLLLQLLVLAAAIFALARPIVETAVTDAERVVILIDRSASMNAREGDESRLEQAQEQAVRLVKTFNKRTSGWRSFFSLSGAEARTQVMVIAFADRATIISPFTTNTSDLEDLIRNIKPTDGRTNMREALDLAEAYMAPPTRLTAGMEDADINQTPVSAAAPAKMVLISDGRVADVDQLVLKGSMELVRVGETGDNVGITRLRTRRNYEQPETLSVYLTVRNFGPRPVHTDVSIYVDGTLNRAKALRLGGQETGGTEAAAGENDAGNGEGRSRSLSFDLLLDKAAVVEARLSRKDALRADDSAFAVVPPPRRLRVLVVTQGNFYLDSAMAGLPLAEYPFVTPAQYEAGDFATDGRSGFDVVVFDKYQPQTLPAGNYLFLGALPKLEEFEPEERVEWHPLIWWDETHPVLRHVSLDHVYVAESRALRVPEQAEILIEGPAGPVLVRYARDGRHYLVLTFAVEKSTWWSRPSFPVFVYNAMRYLGGGGADVEQGPVRPGATLRVPVPAEPEQVRLLRPDGSPVTLTVGASAVAYFGGTEEVGVYRVEGGVPGRDRFAVNLEDEWESDIKPLEGTLRIDAQEVQELETIKTATPEVWRWFIGAALVLLLVEWWIYNRRVML